MSRLDSGVWVISLPLRWSSPESGIRKAEVDFIEKREYVQGDQEDQGRVDK